MHAKKPDFMLWGGDNFYYREPDYTRTGMIHRNDHARAVKSMQPLLANVHQYAICDDHDYGPNDSDRSFPLKNFPCGSKCSNIFSALRYIKIFT